MRKAQDHFESGYALYVANEPESACRSEKQRCGWHNVKRGHLACIAVEEEQPPDGELLRLIDYGAKLQELEDNMEDEAFWAIRDRKPCNE